MLIVGYWLYIVAFIDWQSVCWLCDMTVFVNRCSLQLWACFVVPSFSLIVAMVLLLNVGSDVLYCDILFKFEFLKGVFDLSIQSCWISPLSSSSAYSKQVRAMLSFAPEDFSSERQDSHDCMWQHVKHECLQLWRSQTFTGSLHACVISWAELHNVLH